MAEKSPHISREKIRSILQSLNSNLKRRNSPHYSTNDEVIESIFDALRECQDIITTSPFFADRNNRIERLKAVLKNGNAFLKSLKIAERYNDLTIFNTDIPMKLKVFMDHIMKSARDVFKLETEYANKPGAPVKIHRAVFIKRMADVYEKATGRPPGMPSSGTGGPFLFFITMFLQEIEIDKEALKETTLTSAIRKILKARPHK